MWARNAQLLEGLERPYAIAAKQRASEMHLRNEKRIFFILSTVNSFNNWFLFPRERQSYGPAEDTPAINVGSCGVQDKWGYIVIEDKG